MGINIAIIGSGPGGYVAAIRAAQLGASVTVIEDAEVGGTCLNAGCIPTKALIASSDAFERARSAAEYGIEISGDVRFNLDKVRERKDKIVLTQIKGIRHLFKGRGIDLIDGRGSLLSPGTVRVAKRDGSTGEIKPDKIIIATGSRPARIPGFPLDGKRIITSNEAVRLPCIPKRIIIVGAGVIGCEFAFLYRSFGSEVTVVELMRNALSTEDREISSIIEREMKKAKIKLMTGTSVTRVETSDDTVTANLSNGREITADQLLLSVGRSLNSDGIGLEAVGVEKGRRGEILVNERMETNIPGVYAIGDVTGRMLLAHVASRQGIVAAENALGNESVMDYSVVPTGIFTRPEVGSVGIREQEAIEKGIKYRVGRFQFRALGKAHAIGEINGMVKVLSDAATDRIIGVHICGPHATDLVHEGALAMKAGTTASELGNMIHAHPTLSEAVMESSEDVHDRAIHVLKSGT